ncbi:TPA: VRR-NUC domain-containing protein [Burkholderia aenigmatica]|uniref:VRR-NUC domain-containing protein n=1 Tax=Burkholderia sp. AU45251 TaxID=3059204 RepID=UPI0026556DB3|nr:VRR-NUC domain-containing protein [Burkholderia sp. AU45251]HDR9486853.1 VRR-NUC domain-containing protein [Burkholderia aenigmatica]MDN7518795.1 VRR-NUC domain-containing protein [Burkholderia sp. AU45251]HDR9518769.1 VRR-NUC domain-containing protein [Burkholderia aenigmatica]HDR9595636.1 VRR-NUC domain-containing protein [Burkholderia aenigmatica]HDR9602499.1 VRR-NUC domain-containing protein [Burkholderia aenigmatica]
MEGKLQPAGECQTIKERRPEYAFLPSPAAKGYLQEKVETALKMARYSPVRLPSGSIIYKLLMQQAMSVPMIIEERSKKWNWYFQYKAEVSFDMTSVGAVGPDIPPIPFLAKAKPKGTERRRSLARFPKGATVGKLRRPDVIIVKDKDILWPGRGTVDREGGRHPDNMLRLVEVKFPGDTLGRDQELAYQRIAGDYNTRMTVIDVSDCNGELKKIPKPVPIPAPKTADEQQRQRAAIRTVPAIPHPVWYEDWWQKTGEGIEHAIAPLWDAIHHGYANLSAETRAFLHQHAAWLFTAGQWIVDKTHSAWVWVDEKGQEIFRYTAAQLKAGWEAIEQTSDLTWEVLIHIDWAQVGLTLIEDAAVAVAIVAGVAIVVLLAPELIAIFAALCAIIAAGAEMVVALAATLGVVIEAGADIVVALAASMGEEGVALAAGAG